MSTAEDVKFFEELRALSQCDIQVRTGRCEQGAFVALTENRKHLCPSCWDDLVVSLEVYRYIQRTLEITRVPRAQPGVAG